MLREGALCASHAGAVVGGAVQLAAGAAAESLRRGAALRSGCGSGLGLARALGRMPHRLRHCRRAAGAGTAAGAAAAAACGAAAGDQLGDELLILEHVQPLEAQLRAALARFVHELPAHVDAHHSIAAAELPREDLGRVAVRRADVDRERRAAGLLARQAPRLLAVLLRAAHQDHAGSAAAGGRGAAARAQRAALRALVQLEPRAQLHCSRRVPPAPLLPRDGPSRQAGAEL